MRLRIKVRNMNRYRREEFEEISKLLYYVATYAFFIFTLGRTGARFARYVIRLAGKFSNMVCIIVGDAQDAKSKIDNIPEIATSFKSLIEYLRRHIFILVDNGLKVFKWDASNRKWKGTITSPPIDYQGPDVNDALRDCPIIMAIANQVTEGPSLNHRIRLEGQHLIFAMAKPIYAYGYNAVEQAINVFRTSLQLTNTAIEDLTNRDIIGFWFGVNLSRDTSSDLITEIRDKLQPSNLILIGGNVDSKSRWFQRNDESCLVFTLLLRLKEHDKIGPQFSFVKDFLQG
jgi:hypothetical protein